jgi:hypothetical protein
MKRTFLVTGGFEFRIGKQRVKSGDIVELDDADYIVSMHIGEGVLVDPKPVKAPKAQKE